MPIVVDAYNVVHVTGVLPPDLAGMDVAELVRVIPRTRFASDLVTLVCDGTPGVTMDAVAGSGRVRVRYAGGGKSADDLIAAMVDRSSAPRRLTVVSSDRAVQRSARRRRSTVLTSEEFLRRVADDLHGEHLDAITAAEEEATAAQARAVPKRPSRPTPKVDPLFPVDLIREAAAFALPPEPEDDAEPEAAPAAPPPPSMPPEPPAPAKSARSPAEPLFSADLLAEALDLARDEQSRRSEDAARRRADADARAAGAARDHAEQARIAAEQAGRDAEARRRRDARDRSLADAASSAIGDADLQAIEDLVSRTIPAEQRPKKDETFDSDIVAEAERMLREFGDEPRDR